MAPTRTVEISTAPRFVRARYESAQTEAYHPPASKPDTSVALAASIAYASTATACTMSAASSGDDLRAEHVDLRKKKPRVPFYMGVPKRRKR